MQPGWGVDLFPGKIDLNAYMITISAELLSGDETVIEYVLF
jgi:hypothetical protein